jgi:hypothetical protein
MDERFEELARLVGEQLAQRWMARAERDPCGAERQIAAAAVDGREPAAAPLAPSTSE